MCYESRVTLFATLNIIPVVQKRFHWVRTDNIIASSLVLFQQLSHIVPFDLEFLLISNYCFSMIVLRTVCNSCYRHIGHKYLVLLVLVMVECYD